MSTHLDIIRDIETLPAPSPVVVKLAALAGERHADVAELTSVIRYDPVLRAHLLSQAGRLPGEPASSGTNGHASPGSAAHLQDAVVLMGMAQVLDIAVMLHASELMMPALPAYGLVEGELWRHGIAASLAIEVIEGLISVDLSPGTQAAAFLHDLGKVVLSSWIEQGGTAPAGASRSRQAVFGREELEVLGVDHAMVGARIAQHWGLGSEIVTAIRGHHEPSAGEEGSVQAVGVANLAAKVAGCGLGAEGLNLGADASACGRLGITCQDFEFLCAEVHLRLPAALQSAGRLVGAIR